MNELTEGKNQPHTLTQSGLSIQPTDGTVFDMRHYLRVIWNRRRVIMGVFVAVLTIVGIQVYRTQPVYTATGTIAIEPARQQVIVGVQGFSPTDQSFYDGPLIQMQLDILQSRMLAERVMNKLKLWESPEFTRPPAATDEARETQRTQVITALLSHLQVDEPTSEYIGRRVIRVRYTSTNPRLAARVLNTWFERFIDYNRESNTKAVEFAADWLTEQIAEQENKLQKSKGELLKFQQTTELVYTGEAEKNPATEQFNKLNEQLAEAELTRLNAEILYQRAREGGLEALPASVKGERLTGLEEDRRQLEAELSRLSITYQEAAPPIKNLKQQLAALHTQIQNEQQTRRENMLRNLQNEYEVADDRVRVLRRAAEKQRAEILKQNQDGLQFGLLKREAEVDEKLFQMLSERLREAGFMRSLTPNSNIWIVDRAEIPLVPSSSNRATLVRGALVGLILGLGLALLLEFLNDSVKTVEDVEGQLKLPNLGVVPLVNGEGQRTRLLRKRTRKRAPVILNTSENGHSAFTESYRTLRTSVLLSSATQPPRTIVITSNETGAGKTTTAVNTAIALAQAGKRVLLVDGDLRHPGCAQLFGIDNAVGLSTYLSSPDQPAALHSDCGVAGLNVLPSGPPPPNPSELLSSRKTRALIQSLAAQHDHVIIDTPPVALVSDALIFSALVDGVILVVKAEENSRRGILRTKDALRNVNAKILGVVLNAVDLRRHQDGYYGYGYGHSALLPD